MRNASLCRVSLLACAVFLLLGLEADQTLGQVHRYYPAAHTYHPEHGYVPVGRYGYGGYGGYGGAMSAQEGAGIGYGVAATGLGNLASSVGQMHEANAQAEVTHQQAVTSYLQNKNLAQQTTIEMADRRRKAANDQIARMRQEEQQRIATYHKSLDQMAAAHRLTAAQFDMSRGVLHWPFCLRGSEYADLREKIDQLYASRTPEDSGQNSDNYGPIKQACDQMLAIVKTEVKKGMQINDFVTAQHFISSIEYESRFKVQPSK